VNQGYAIRVKADTAIGIRAGGTIFQIALDGTTHCGKLRTYLMMPAGEDFYLQQGITLRMSHSTVTQDSFF
jgi:hypothetical protein